MIKDRAHEVLSILLVFTSNNILSFTLNYLLVYSAAFTQDIGNPWRLKGSKQLSSLSIKCVGIYEYFYFRPWKVIE